MQHDNILNMASVQPPTKVVPGDWIQDFKLNPV